MALRVQAVLGGTVTSDNLWIPRTNLLGSSYPGSLDPADRYNVRGWLTLAPGSFFVPHELQAPIGSFYSPGVYTWAVGYDID